VSAAEGHLATRRAAGLFDFSFMSLCEVSGAGAAPFLGHLQTRIAAALQPGQIAYTLLLREDASVFVDATLWRHADERWWIFTGRRSDVAWIAARAAGFDVALRDRSGEFAILALQGPRCFELIADAPRWFHFAEARLEGIPAWVARLGYSGELGVEILVPAAAGAALRDRLRKRGARECGFDTADSLRIESGYILFSNELAALPDPFELGLGRLATGSAFVGAEALRRKRFAGPRRKLVGLVPTGSARAPGSLPAAQLTSEAFSPIFGRQLGMGFAPAQDASPGTLVRVADGRLARCARLPFYDPGRVLPRGCSP
jgi:aminomethyltransferase